MKSKFLPIKNSQYSIKLSPPNKTFQFFQIGGGLDTKSGIFTAPIAGAYLFIVHVCSADMSKALLAIR